jgi:hypothetical protein
VVSGALTTADDYLIGSAVAMACVALFFLLLPLGAAFVYSSRHYSPRAVSAAEATTLLGRSRANLTENMKSRDPTNSNNSV